MKTAELILYFDGKCPFCAAEMGRLRSWDMAGKLAFIDISLPGFDPASIGADMDALNRELHSIDAKGKLLVGVASMLAAYTLVGRGWIVMPLRVPVLKSVLASLYRQFARNRYRMSRLLGYRAVECNAGTCHRTH